MNFKRILLVIFVFAINSDFAFSQSKIQEILLPTQQNTSTNYFNNSPKWEEFTDTYSGWTAIIDPVTNTAHRAFGKPIKINGFHNITEYNVKHAAATFLEQHQNALNINFEQLKFISARKARNKWYVSYRQHTKGYDVLLSEIELRITEDAKVMALGIDFYNDINIKDNITITYDEAFNAAIGLNNTKQNKYSLLSKNNEGKKYILPIKNRNSINYKLVYEVPFKNKLNNQNYLAYVDVNSGETVWRTNRTLNNLSEVTSKALIKEKYATDDFVEKPLENLYINIGEEQYLTDEAGAIEVNVPTNTSIHSDLSGPYCRIISPNQFKFEDSIKAGENYNIIWDDALSPKWERHLFYHVNHARNWITGIDTSLDFMDYQLVLDLQEESGKSFGYGPNGYSTMDGDTIGFVAFMNDSLLLTESPTVFYHEYAHATNIKIYKGLGQTQGMMNMATHEAIADISAAFMINDPIVGRGVFTNEPERYIRTCENNNTYPDSVMGESHHDGQILSGAIWDLSKTLGQEKTIDLMHFSRYGLPDDLNTGIAYSEWFMEFLITDDDDGDLTNGTPNMKEIIKAFNKHKIGTNLLYAFQFVHEKLDDIGDKNASLTMNFKMEKLDALSSSTNNFKMLYTIDDWQTTYEEECTTDDSVNYTAIMPGIGKAGILKYRFTCYDKLSEDTLSFPVLEKSEYELLYGYYTNEHENFEEAENWTIGLEDDDAITGQFEIGVPGLASVDGSERFTIQPEGDYSEEGDKCIVTDKRAASFFDMSSKSLSKGKTSVLSPVYNLSLIETPIVKYHYWYNFMAFTAPPENMKAPRVNFEATTDNGESWILLDQHFQPDNRWNLTIIYLPDSIATSENVQFKLTAINTFDEGIIVEVLFDEFKILSPVDIILGVKKENIVENSDNIRVYPNPFNNSITIDCYFNNSSFKEIAVYDGMGNKVRTLFRGLCVKGNKEIKWDGLTDDLARVNPGIYFIKVLDKNTAKILNVIKI